MCSSVGGLPSAKGRLGGHGRWDHAGAMPLRAAVGHLQPLQLRLLLTQPLPWPVPPAPLPESWPSATALNPVLGPAAGWGLPQGGCFPGAAFPPRHPAWLSGPRWGSRGPRVVGGRPGEGQLSPLSPLGLQKWPTPPPGGAATPLLGRRRTLVRRPHWPLGAVPTCPPATRPTAGARHSRTKRASRARD